MPKLHKYFILMIPTIILPKIILLKSLMILSNISTLLRKHVKKWKKNKMSSHNNQRTYGQLKCKTQIIYFVTTIIWDDCSQEYFILEESTTHVENNSCSSNNKIFFLPGDYRISAYPTKRLPSFCFLVKGLLIFNI